MFGFVDSWCELLPSWPGREPSTCTGPRSMLGASPPPRTGDRAAAVRSPHRPTRPGHYGRVNDERSADQTIGHQSSGGVQVPEFFSNSTVTTPCAFAVKCAVIDTLATGPPDEPIITKCSVSVKLPPAPLRLPPNQDAPARR